MRDFSTVPPVIRVHWSTRRSVDTALGHPTLALHVNMHRLPGVARSARAGQVGPFPSEAAGFDCVAVVHLCCGCDRSGRAIFAQRIGRELRRSDPSPACGIVRPICHLLRRSTQALQHNELASTSPLKLGSRGRLSNAPRQLVDSEFKIRCFDEMHHRVTPPTSCC